MPMNNCIIICELLFTCFGIFNNTTKINPDTSILPKDMFYKCDKYGHFCNNHTIPYLSKELFRLKYLNKHSIITPEILDDAIKKYQQDVIEEQIKIMNVMLSKNNKYS
jgi:hypothetical protein